MKTGLDLVVYNCLSTAVAFGITWLSVVCWFVNTRPKTMDLSASFLVMPSLRIGVPHTGGNLWNFDFPKSVYMTKTWKQLWDNCKITARPNKTWEQLLAELLAALWAAYPHLSLLFSCSGKLSFSCLHRLEHAKTNLFGNRMKKLTI